MEKLVKAVLKNIGSHLSASSIHKLNSAISYMETGRWLAQHDFRPAMIARRRTDLFDLIIKDLPDGDVLYMEFGVFRGESIRYWANHLTNPRAVFHGFDTFEGLPEDWNIIMSKGHFSTQGSIPLIDDPRVTFFKGRFEETLPGYVPPFHERLVLMMDADLYSSTIYVLHKLSGIIVPGTYIYFDEFSDRLNELRAFAEFLQETAARFELVGSTRESSQVVFKRIA